MQESQESPPRAPPIQYTAPLGTRWGKEKAAAGGSAAFDLPTDPKMIGPWVLGECIGKGASGRVKIARHQRTRQLAAVKILPIAPLVNSRASLETQQAKSEKQRLGIDREITMMKLMNHPNIMRIYDVYEGEKELFLVLEYVEGGELFDFLVNRGRLPPNEALIYFRQIILGLNYAHTFSIIHRDLKPENILIASLNPPVIKIADWGMAAFAPPMLQLETSCGSPHYASPEIVNGEKYFGTATDIWSCGVILYALLTGRLPFDDKNVRTLLSKVKSGKYDVPSWMDPLAKDLLTKMLVVDVRKRITIPDILLHPWFLKRGSSTSHQPPPELSTLDSPPLPPSPSTLARPIPSPDMIDPELFASLRIIWGRHADPQGLTITQDLCSPAGQGVHAKAFYFLLAKYREESLRNRSKDSEEGNQDSRVDSPDKLYLGWDLDQSRGHTKKIEANAAGSCRLEKVLPTPKVHEAACEGGVEDSRVKSLDLSGESRSANARRAPQDLRKRQSHSYSSSSGMTVVRGTMTSMSTINYAHPRATTSRRGYTQSVSHTQTHEQRRITDPTGQRGPEQYLGTPRQSHATFDDQPIVLDIQRHSSTVLAPSSVYSPRISTSPMDVDGPVNSTKLASAEVPTQELPGEDGTAIPSGLPNVKSAVEVKVETNTSPIDNITSEIVSELHSHSPFRPRTNASVMAEKENSHVVDDGWTAVEKDITQPRNATFGMPGNANREVGREVGNNVDAVFVLSDTRAKKDKDKKNRPPPIELPPVYQRRTLVGSQAMTPNPQGLSGGHRIMASPVVGEFKGWFSNLFNWKSGSSPPSCVFYSAEDLSKTREMALRLFQSLTFGISRAILDINGDNSEIYHCRLDQSVSDGQNLNIKPIRLRVEFSLVVPASPLIPVPMVAASENSPYNGLLPSSPNPVSASGLRTRNSVALGRTPSNIAPITPLTTTHWELPLGCACVLVMTYEKGSSSTFRIIRQRLRDMFSDPPGSALSPCFSPNLPNSAFSETQRAVV